jgi:hypothetical protein
MFQNESLEKISTTIKEISEKYYIDKKNIIKYFINFIIRKKSFLISHELLIFMENIMHYQDCKNSVYINYSISRLTQLLSKKNSLEASS